MSETLGLSIIIPVFNAEKYLLKCINSILEQNIHTSYEIILIDDASTDESLNIIKTEKFSGKLIGLKGQYLIFEDGTVFNVRSNEGVVVNITVN